MQDLRECSPAQRLLLVVYCLDWRRLRKLLRNMSASQITKRFGASVRSLRHSLGLSQEALAERADLHRTYIAGIERGGRNITLKSIEKLAKALQVSTADLLLAEGATAGMTDPRRAPQDGKIVEILLVEDNPDDAELTRRAFRAAKIANHLHIVHDGTEALDYLFGTESSLHSPHKRPHLILLDLNLPKIGGLDVLRRVKREPSTQDIPVIVLTVSQKDRDVEESRRLGAATYIVKPVDFQSFTQATPQLQFQWALFQPSEALGN
jgi:two-component system response regulator